MNPVHETRKIKNMFKPEQIQTSTNHNLFKWIESKLFSSILALNSYFHHLLPVESEMDLWSWLIIIIDLNLGSFCKIANMSGKTGSSPSTSTKPFQ